MTIKQVLFSFKGRISRQDYWLKGIIPQTGITIILTMALSTIEGTMQLVDMNRTFEEIAKKTANTKTKLTIGFVPAKTFKASPMLISVSWKTSANRAG